MVSPFSWAFICFTPAARPSHLDCSQGSTSCVLASDLPARSASQLETNLTNSPGRSRLSPCLLRLVDLPVPWPTLGGWKQTCFGRGPSLPGAWFPFLAPGSVSACWPFLWCRKSHRGVNETVGLYWFGLRGGFRSPSTICSNSIALWRRSAVSISCKLRASPHTCASCVSSCLLFPQFWSKWTALHIMRTTQHRTKRG